MLCCVVLYCLVLSFVVLCCVVLCCVVFVVLTGLVLCCLVLCCLVLCCLVLSCLVLSGLVLSCLVSILLADYTFFYSCRCRAFTRRFGSPQVRKKQGFQTTPFQHFSTDHIPVTGRQAKRPLLFIPIFLLGGGTTAFGWILTLCRPTNKEKD